jgi:pantetheine-phosphate adenylyltransferase
MQPKNHVTGIYPGSFDPVTEGHLDLISRATRVLDRLVVAVLKNEHKNPMFTVSERMEMLRAVLCKRFPNVEVDSFEGLLVDYCAQKNATVIVRGIRAISDYEYELQTALMNRRLRPELETVFFMAGEQYSFLSSRIVKEVIRLGGNGEGMVPQPALDHLKQRFAENQKK